MRGRPGARGKGRAAGQQASLSQARAGTAALRGRVPPRPRGAHGGHTPRARQKSAVPGGVRTPHLHVALEVGGQRREEGQHAPAQREAAAHVLPVCQGKDGAVRPAIGLGRRRGGAGQGLPGKNWAVGRLGEAGGWRGPEVGPGAFCARGG